MLKLGNPKSSSFFVVLKQKYKNNAREHKTKRANEPRIVDYFPIFGRIFVDSALGRCFCHAFLIDSANAARNRVADAAARTATCSAAKTHAAAHAESIAAFALTRLLFDLSAEANR